MTKTALITGISGQDGAFLAQLLLSKGYKVFGGVRRTSQRNLQNLEKLGIINDVKLVDLELCEQSNITNLVRDYQFDEIYNLGAQSFVGVSFRQPVYTTMVDGLTVLYFLDAIKNYSKHTKFYQASTSEMFGLVQEVPQKETTPFYPRSPYGVAKLFAHNTVVNYRESYDLFACSGILFNHESELRGKEFVTRKITLNVAKRANGSQKILELGNLEAKRDWGYSKEYVEAMYLMLQQDKPQDFVIATGETYTVKDFVEYAFKVINVDIIWGGKDENTKGYNKDTNELLVQVNPEFYRPAEVDLLLGNPTKAKQTLGWEAKTKVKDLAEIMVLNDLKQLKK